MKFRYSIIVLAAAITIIVHVAFTDAKKMVCYYNSQSYWRQGIGKITYEHLKPALEHCDYLIYCFIGINSNTYQAESLDPKLDLSTGKNNFKAVTDFKNAHPNLKILLSLGGFADRQSPEKYLKMMENRIHRINFICSLMSILKEYDFDGIDLAWEFPIIKELPTTSTTTTTTTASKAGEIPSPPPPDQDDRLLKSSSGWWFTATRSSIDNKNGDKKRRPRKFSESLNKSSSDPNSTSSSSFWTNSGFPRPPWQIRSFQESVWKAVQSYGTFFIADDNPEEHRKYFVQLCRELRAAVNGENKTLTLSINPTSNYKVYYDLDALNEFVEQIHLLTYDYRRPEQTPETGDYSAPLYPCAGRDPDKNVEATVNYFLNSSIPVEKLIMAIPTFARTWKLTSSKSAVPPVTTNGPGDGGMYTNADGVLAYYEICLDLTTLTDSSSLPSDYYTIAQEVNPSYGMYAYRLRKSGFFGSDGMWISYETPEMAAVKGEFARSKGLGGIAISDLTMDDFRGHCATRRDMYPITRAARASFMGLNRNRTH